MPKLKLLKSTGEQKTYSIDKPKFTLGRSGENDLQINDASVSRHHAEIVEEGNQFKLIDKQSKCGTHLNGTRIQSSFLKHQDRIQLGNEAQLVFLTHEDVIRETASIAPPDAPSVIMSLARNDMRNVSRLLEMARVFSGASSLHEILDVVLDIAIEVTRAERAFIVLKNEAGEPRFQRGRDKGKQPLTEDCFHVSRTVLQQVLTEGRRVLMSDVEGPVSDSILNLELRTIVCLPLVSFEIGDSPESSTGRQKVIGALYLDGKQATEDFSQISQGILDSLTQDTTAVIENTRLLKASREKERLEMELSTAREIQATILPTIRGSYGFFEAYAQNIPSRHIGGDCYDLIKLDDGRFGMMIADVSGKGVSAALLGSMVQGILYAEAMRHPSVAQTIKSANSYLVQRTGGQKFVTLFYAVLSAAGELKFVNAGHNPPILIHPEGVVEELFSGGVILGAFDFAEYEENSIYMRPGDLLCLFTDGVTEARDKNGDMLGEEALRSMLVSQRKRPVEQIVESIFQHVAEFSEGVPQSDDVSVLVVRYVVTSEN